MRSLFDSSTFPSSLHVASTSRVRQSSATDTTLTLDKVFGDALIQYTEKTKANNIKNTQFRGDTANLHPSSFQIESHYELSELKTGVTDEYQLKSSCFQHSFDLRYGGWRRRSPNVFSVSNENLCRRSHEVHLRVIPLKVFLIYREKINFFLTSQRVLMFLFNNKQTKQEATCALHLSDFLLIHFRSSINTERDHLGTKFVFLQKVLCVD